MSNSSLLTTGTFPRPGAKISPLAELAQATGASARGLSAIADLLVGFALLTRDDDGRYALTPESDAFLVSYKPSFMGGIFCHMSSQLLPN